MTTRQAEATSTPPSVLLAMGERTRDALITPSVASRLATVAQVNPSRSVTAWDDPAVAEDLASVDVLLTCWGAPRINADALERMPRLRMVAHAAGSVGWLVDPVVFSRGIVVTSAAEANAVPVAEYTVAAIVFAMKRVLRFAEAYRSHPGVGAWDVPVGDVGTYGKTIGVVGASRIGRRVIGLLRPMDVRLLLADPTVTAAEASECGAELVELDELCRRSDIVTLHAPSLPSTHRMLDERRLALLADGATVINTARGALVDTAALTAEVITGRIDAVLDVTDPEPLPADSPLFTASNVLLTPHIAGSLGTELVRLAESAVTEIDAWRHGRPPIHPVVADDFGRIA